MEVARAVMWAASGTGTARTLVTEASASAAETEEIMREEENMVGS